MPEPPFPPNFYYRQQRFLHDFCNKHGIEWVVTHSSEVVGYAKGNFMNLASAVAIYGAVSKELGKELFWPGSEDFYTNVTMFTDAGLHGRFCHWAALEPRAANQVFNVVNGDAESWMNLWPRLAKYFGLKVPADQLTRPAPMPSEMALEPRPPLSVQEEAAGLAGHTPQSHVRQRVDLVKWSQSSEVQEAWKKLAQREGLDASSLDKASWAFAGYCLGRDYNASLSMSKARKLGWTGYIDSWESLEETLKQLREGKVIA